MAPRAHGRPGWPAARPPLGRASSAASANNPGSILLPGALSSPRCGKTIGHLAASATRSRIQVIGPQPSGLFSTRPTSYTLRCPSKGQGQERPGHTACSTASYRLGRTKWAARTWTRKTAGTWATRRSGAQRSATSSQWTCGPGNGPSVTSAGGTDDAARRWRPPQNGLGQATTQGIASPGGQCGG